MKPYSDLNGKNKWFLFWGDKTNRKMRKIFKKSIRQKLKKELYGKSY